MSELGTNAIIHPTSGSSAGTFHIALARSDQVVAIAVIDTGGTGNVPHPDHVDQDATQGRGPNRLAALATSFEIHGDQYGRTITTELLMMKPNDEAHAGTAGCRTEQTETAACSRPNTPDRRQGSSWADTTGPPQRPRLYQNHTPRPGRTAGTSIMRATEVTTRPGYWCECIMHTPDTITSPATVASFEATSPAQAVRWIRIAARTLASSLDPGAFRDTWDWITEGHREASDALNRGEPCAFAITQDQTRVEWTARPVLFLPVVPGGSVCPRDCATESPAISDRRQASPETRQTDPNATE